MGTKLPNGTNPIQTGVKLLKNLSLQPYMIRKILEEEASRGIDSGNRPIRPRGKNQYNKQKIYTQIFQNIKNFKKIDAVQVGG
jgi:hypothetical protein